MSPAAPTPVRLAVMSDIHATDQGAGVVARATANDAEVNALTALREKAQTEKFRADLLVCPGDLTDKADPAALAYCWEQLHAIANELGASVIATAGNHDLDSKHHHTPHDTLKALKELKPLFPIDDWDRANEYFARQMTSVTLDGTRAIILDTCHFHQAGDPAEHDRGRVERRTVELVEEQLAVDEPGLLHLLLCHHQPLRWNPEPFPADPKEIDRTETRGGTYLVEALERAAHQSWLLIHGHRHTPAVGYMGNTTGGPVRFAAGSFGGVSPAHTPGIPNQFYLLDVWPDGSCGSALSIAGRFRAWDWVAEGWTPARRESGIPGMGGFGYRANGRDLASWALELGQRHLNWDDLVKQDPKLEYLAPCDMFAFERSLDRGGHGVLPDANGRIEEIALK